MMVFPAKPGDAPTLTRIAFAAKAHWGYPAAWLAEWEPGLRVTPEFLAANEVFVARPSAGGAGEILGWAALVAAADGALWLDHLWVQPAAMGRGVGRVLFEHAVARARARGFASLRIESDPHAEPFYQRMGARRTGLAISMVQGTPRALPLLEHSLGLRAPAEAPAASPPAAAKLGAG